MRPETDALRFGLRRVTGVDPDAPTPWWMRRRLLLAGQRSVNLPTDITNYVMLLLGQPMHAFDGGAIAGGLTVRNAVAGETLTTLDHVERTLDPEDVVICETGVGCECAWSGCDGPATCVMPFASGMKRTLSGADTGGGACCCCCLATGEGDCA